MSLEIGSRKNEGRHVVRMKQHQTGRKNEKRNDEVEPRINLGIFCKKQGALKIMQLIVTISACFATAAGNWLLAYNHLFIYHYALIVIITCSAWVFVLAMASLFNVHSYFKDPRIYYKIEYHCYVIMIVLLLPPSVLTFYAIGKYAMVISAVLQVVSILLFLISVNDLYSKWNDSNSSSQQELEKPAIYGKSEYSSESSRSKYNRENNEELRIKNRLRELTKQLQHDTQKSSRDASLRTKLAGNSYHDETVQLQDYSSETESKSKSTVQSNDGLSRKNSVLTDDTFNSYRFNQIIYRINEEAKKPLTTPHKTSLVDMEAHETELSTFEDTLARENDQAHEEYLKNLYQESAVKSSEFEQLVQKMNHILDENNVTKSTQSIYQIDSDAATYPPPFHISSVSTTPHVKRNPRFNEDTEV